MKKGAAILFLSFFIYIINAQTDSPTHFRITSGYSIDRFSTPYYRNFNIYSVGLGYKGPKTALYGIYNAGDLSNGSGNGTLASIESQFETDFYHKLSRRLNYWVNYAYSRDASFPDHRVMSRLWFDLGSGFLVSGGVKYYYFDKNLFTATVGFEKYIGRFWTEGKTLVHFKDPDPRLSYQLNSRVFWKDHNYLQLSLMTGAASDEPWRTGGLLPVSLNSHGAGLRLVTHLGKTGKFQLRLNALYQYEEYSSNSWRNRYTGGISLDYTIF